MTEINHILVPTDGSEGACKAAAFAGDLARALGARVSLLYVQSEDLVVERAWNAIQSVDEIRASLEENLQAKELPDTVKALGKLSDAPETFILWGQPASQICGFAAEHSADLIVIGSHGRSGIREALLGSVSHAVANSALCPVTIVR